VSIFRVQSLGCDAHGDFGVVAGDAPGCGVWSGCDVWRAVVGVIGWSGIVWPVCFGWVAGVGWLGCADGWGGRGVVVTGRGNHGQVVGVTVVAPSDTFFGLITGRTEPAGILPTGGPTVFDGGDVINLLNRRVTIGCATHTVSQC